MAVEKKRWKERKHKKNRWCGVSKKNARRRAPTENRGRRGVKTVTARRNTGSKRSEATREGRRHQPQARVLTKPVTHKASTGQPWCRRWRPPATAQANTIGARPPPGARNTKAGHAPVNRAHPRGQTQQEEQAFFFFFRAPKPCCRPHAQPFAEVNGREACPGDALTPPPPQQKKEHQHKHAGRPSTDGPLLEVSWGYFAQKKTEKRKTDQREKIVVVVQNV